MELFYLIVLFVIAFVFAVLKLIIEGTFHLSLKSGLREYITELKCLRRKKYGPDYSLEYKIDKIETEGRAATVYCVFSEKFSKNDITKEKNEIIYLVDKGKGGNDKWVVVDEKDNNESTQDN